VAGEIAPIISDTKVVGLHEVAPGTNVDGETIGPGTGQTHGWTHHDAGTGATDIYIAFSKSGPSGKNESTEWEPVDATMTSNHKPIYRDSGTVIGHELGHAWAFMTGDVGSGPTGDRNQQASLRLENKVRKLRNPSAATRTVH